MTRDLGPRRSEDVSAVEDVVEDEDPTREGSWVEGEGDIVMLCMVDASDALRLDGTPDSFCSCGVSGYESSEGILEDALRFFREGDVVRLVNATGGLSSRRRRLGTYPVCERVNGLCEGGVEILFSVGDEASQLVSCFIAIWHNKPNKARYRRYSIRTSSTPRFDGDFCSSLF